jgi:hypothetical protein
MLYVLTNVGSHLTLMPSRGVYDRRVKGHLLTGFASVQCGDS